MMRNRVLSLGAVLAALALSGPAPAQTAAAPPSPEPLVRGLPDFADLAERVGPAVVNIRTTERVRAGSAGPNGMNDEEMEEFFRRFFGERRGGPRPSPRQERPAPSEREVPRGVGSGFILSADGYVMTNAHVVDGADKVVVTLPDKREFKARIVGADKRTDVALVKIEGTGLPVVRIGDAGRLRVGEWVVAIGSPFGLDNTVTAGIVSAKQRDTGDYLPLIQTDVAVNPGNSGGPLINMRGEVVGINSQIYSRSGGFMGISFAIPIDEAMRVSDQLRASGKVTRGRIGVQIGRVGQDVAESIGLGKSQGALVRSVEKGSPADKAGVQLGDIITKFDGHTVEKVSDLPRMVGNTKPGTRSMITVFRHGSSRDLPIVVTELEQDTSAQDAPSASERRDDAAKATPAAQALGLTVRELSEAQKKELKLERGVLVQAATDAAASAGLREGDVVLAVGNTEVNSVAQLESALAKADQDKPVALLISRGDLAQYVLIRRMR